MFDRGYRVGQLAIRGACPMSEGLASGGHSANQSFAYRAGARDSMQLRVSMQREIDPIQASDARFDPRDFATNSFVILFFSLVFFAPLFVLGAAIKGFFR
jgi:hypothetical protein